MPEGVVTNVIERRHGSELAADYTASDPTLTVVNPDEFDPIGLLQIGSEIQAYSIDEDGIATLKVALSNSYDEAEPVWPVGLDGKPAVERVAFFQEPGSEEELEARVPHALYSRLATGTRSTGELVECDLRGDELVVADIQLRAPVVDVAFAADDSDPNRGYAEELTEENTTATSPTDLATPGPSVTIEVPDNGLVSVFVSVDIKANGGGGGYVTLYDDVTNLGVVATGSYSSFITFYSPPDQGFSAALVFPISAGTHTFTLQYSRAGGTSADFKNRKLWVWLLGL